MADRLATLLEDQSIVDPVEEYKGTHLLVVVAYTVICQGGGNFNGLKNGIAGNLTFIMVLTPPFRKPMDSCQTIFILYLLDFLYFSLNVQNYTLIGY